MKAKGIKDLAFMFNMFPLKTSFSEIIKPRSAESAPMCLPCLWNLHHFRLPIPQHTYDTCMFISSKLFFVFPLNDSADRNKVNPLSCCSASLVYQAPGAYLVQQPQRHIQFITWCKSGMYQKHLSHYVSWFSLVQM